MHPPCLKYRPDIDGLRAIAVGAVVAFHAFPKALRGGFVGVDVFFVISGYLISTIIFENLDNQSFRVSDFFARRIKRIFPALLLVIISCGVYGYCHLFPNDFSQFGKHVWSGSMFFSNFTLWSESGYFDAATETKPLLHLWSLAIEEQFYILWPVVLYFSWKKKSSVLPTILIFLLLSFLANVYWVEKKPSMAFYLPLFRFWEILCGAFLAYLTKYRPGHFLVKPDLKNAQVRSGVGFILLALGIGFLSNKRVFPGWWALLPVTGTFLILSAGDQGWLNKKILSNKRLIQIGLISYPLYLWHWPLLSFLKLWEITTPSLPLRLAAVLLAFVLSWITYHYVEIPLRKVKLKGYKTHVLCALMILVGFYGYFTYSQSGFPGRWPREIRDIAAITDPYEYFNYRTHTRTGICHSIPKNKEANCIETKRPLVFLMGDSYAASLYPGLKASSDKYGFGIAQFTAGNAPPFLDLDPHVLAENGRPVNKINRHNLKLIQKYGPEIVMIAWKYDQKNRLSLRDSIESINATTSEIKKRSPHSKIVVIGPVPQWYGSLFAVYQKYWLENETMMPLYSDFDLDKDFIRWDKKLEAGIHQVNGAVYVSAYKIMCHQEGCLTRTGNEARDLSAVDEGHLSSAGSKYLVGRFISALLPI